MRWATGRARRPRSRRSWAPLCSSGAVERAWRLDRPVRARRRCASFTGRRAWRRIRSAPTSWRARSGGRGGRPSSTRAAQGCRPRRRAPTDSPELLRGRMTDDGHARFRDGGAVGLLPCSAVRRFCPSAPSIRERRITFAHSSSIMSAGEPGHGSGSSPASSTQPASPAMATNLQTSLAPEGAVADAAFAERGQHLDGIALDEGCSADVPPSLAEPAATRRRKSASPSGALSTGSAPYRPPRSRRRGMSCAPVLHSSGPRRPLIPQ